jgi:phenylalanyl-tRNA synthetase alpha chain
LSRKGKMAELMKTLPQTDPNSRKAIGTRANEVKLELEGLLAETETPNQATDLDVSLPIHIPTHGHEHPVQKIIAELYTIFGSLGFAPFLTPEVETEQDNFDSLRVAADHPARDMQDTFWTKDHMVLRTHTTAFQAHAIKQLKAPFAVMQGGKIYRNEAEDASHLSEFHQFDCFAIAKGLAFSDLKGVLYKAMRELFGPDTKIRFRPSFFPFVEPGAELDIECVHCHGKGCKSCGQKGWLEMLGCGMTHPDIIKSAGLDPQEYSGIAFGAGVERMVMIKYAVSDIREFTKNDPRFLEQLT